MSEERKELRLEDLERLSSIEHSFAYNRVIGNVGKELVRTLLEDCGYSVYPFGYESYLTHIKDLIHRQKLEKLPIVQRMPDLLVTDEETRSINLVEVITSPRRKPNDAYIKKTKLDELKKFWPDSILVLVAPRGEKVFYAERVCELKITDPEYVNFDISESTITKYFPRVEKSMVLGELQDLCRKLFSSLQQTTLP
jgi:hypothetical protein